MMPLRGAGSDLFGRCAFGEANDLPNFGAVTLEIFLLGVDPADERLISREAFWAGCHA